MQEARTHFAQRLRDAMAAAGYDAKPSVLEREFNTRHWGKPMTLHGVRRWLLGETMPDHKKLVTLAEWLGTSVQELGYGERAAAPQAARSQPLWHAGMGYQDRELFEVYLRLPVPQRRLARDVILAIARAHAAEEAERKAR
ncbi:MAG: DNA-binding protein [Comamonadaceae bacterium SCN 68-20]|jgi:transcriptional regulator with XRE-family HTH domain|nr:MAG: DNA-binding protein [Comamonadaceae bacterium SCN 68-20]OJX04279.1 MAG: DNA-binding protein [Burkholderiales bacterium 68-20]UJB66287.1 XRE family transcriptional regulator [Acidovorax sp. YS12]